MTIHSFVRRKGILLIALASPAAMAANSPLSDHLFLSRSIYSGTSSTVTVGQLLPPGSTAATGKPAVADGTYPTVFNNAPSTVDGSFGVSPPFYLDVLDPNGQAVQTLNLTTLAGGNFVTSFPSKSEGALHLSTDGRSVTLMGYVATPNTLDVSNSNTPNHVDSTNLVTSTYQRAVAQLDLTGKFHVTPVNAYSGNNGRSAILANNVNGSAGVNNYYLVGNAGNGSGTQPDFIVKNTGVQFTTPGGSAETTVIGAHQGTVGAANGSQYGFSITQLPTTPPTAADKSGKDNNYRGLTIFNNTLYVTKGSGSNGVNTVYQVGTTGQLPTAATAASTTISILPGFSTTLAKTPTGVTYTGPNPFGLWFATDHILYVADEGDGTAGDVATSTYAGLQKWALNDTDNKWHPAYTLQNGLELGQYYTVSGGYNADTTVNPNGSGTSYYPVATDGLRHITGKKNADGTVTIYATTSTVSTSGDQGADPNRLVSITDTLSATSLPVSEAFTTLKQARFGELFRGVALISAGSN
jgi:hypothetical protein